MDVVAATQSLALTDGSAWILMGMAVMAVIYLTIRPRKKDPLAAQSPLRISLSQQKALERDMQNVVVELSELARQMSAQLETRAAKLELLIADADDRIAKLSAANAAADRAQPLAIATVTAEESPLATLRSPESVRPMRLAQADSEERWNDVYHRADDGLSLTEIARALNRPQGEIELILALRPKRRAEPVDANVAVAVG